MRWLKRLFLGLLVLLGLLIVLPPLWFMVFPADPPPSLPQRGEMVEVRPRVQVNVLDQGTGAPVVMVHGLPGSAYDWFYMSAGLAERGLRAVAYDRVGYGHSEPRLDDRYNIEANTEELLTLLAELDLRNVTVVGWSYGGVIAMQAAQWDPAREARIGRIVLVGSGGPSSADDKPPEPPAAMRLLYSDPVLKWRAAVPPIGRGLMTALSAQAFSGQPQPGWWMERLAANFAQPATITTYRGEMLYPIVDAGEFNPAAIALPTLVVHGSDDRLAPVTIGRYLGTVIPGAQYHEIDGASHMLPITHSERLIDLMDNAWSLTQDDAEPAVKEDVEGADS